MPVVVSPRPPLAATPPPAAPDPRARPCRRPAGRLATAAVGSDGDRPGEPPPPLANNILAVGADKLLGALVRPGGRPARGPERRRPIAPLAPAGPQRRPSCAVPVEHAGAIAPGKTRRVTAFGQNLVLARNAFGQLFAMDDVCPHAGASLAQGTVHGSRLRCCYHGAEYDRDGQCTSGAGAPNTAFDVTEANGIVFVGLRGLAGAEAFTDGTRIPFVEEMGPAGFTPSLTVTQKDTIQNDFSLVYDNIISVEHLVGVHKMVPSRNQAAQDPETLTFEQPLSALGRRIFGQDHLVCTIRMRPPFASFVEQHLDDGRRAQIFMFAVPAQLGKKTELLTVWRQNFVGAAGLPGLPLQAWVRECLFRPLVQKAIEEDREVIDAQTFFGARPPRATRPVGRTAARRLGPARAVRPEARPAGRPRVLVVGASGKTGRCLLDELLDAGHEVTALVRDLGQIPLQHIRLRVQVGDVLAAHSVRAAMPGHEAVIVALGGRRGGPPDVCARGTRHIVEAMRGCGVNRLVAVTSYGLGNTRRFMRRFLGLPYEQLFFRLAMGPMLDDKARQEAVIRASGLNWTLLRPRQLVDLNDRQAEAREDGSSVGTRISRHAVAHFARRVLGAESARQKAFALSRA